MCCLDVRVHASCSTVSDASQTPGRSASPPQKPGPEIARPVLLRLAMHLEEDRPSNNIETGTPHYQTLRQQLPEVIVARGYPCPQPSNRLFQPEYSLSDQADSLPR